MKYFAVLLVLPLFNLQIGQGGPPKAVALPYVYTQWKHFTVKDGLPNDHIFAVKADGPKIWVGTENGLACIDKRTGKIESWTEEDGLPWRVVSSLDVNTKTGELWIGLFGGGLARFSGGRFDHWHQLNSGLSAWNIPILRVTGVFATSLWKLPGQMPKESSVPIPGTRPLVQRSDGQKV